MEKHKELLRRTKGSSMLTIAVIIATILIIAAYFYFTRFGGKNPFTKGPSYNPCAGSISNRTATITISSNEMTPSTVMICPGQEVRWINNDTVSHKFTVTSKGLDAARLRDIDPIAPSETVTLTFNTAETIDYSVGSSKGFTGQIIVGK